MLWEALAQLEARSGAGAFSGSYSWTYYHQRSARFDAAFVRQLNEAAWIPDANGVLQSPEFLVFESLDWTPNPLLLSKIHFKPPLVDALAREAGIEPGTLDLLKRLGLTSETELRRKLGVTEDEVHGAADEPQTSSLGGGASLRADAGNQIAGPASVVHLDEPGVGGGRGVAEPRGGKRTPGSAGERPFISYIGAHPDGEESDPEGMDHAERMALEDKAITIIRRAEAILHRTPTNNPGFDLFEPGTGGQPVRWVEVKAMSGSLRDRAACTARMRTRARRCLLALHRREGRERQPPHCQNPGPTGQGTDLHI